MSSAYLPIFGGTVERKDKSELEGTPIRHLALSVHNIAGWLAGWLADWRLELLLEGNGMGLCLYG